ncbi:enterochelin esterase domain-containing protein [Xylanimonas ulmi]|uniref:Enterochelin esterase family protein n=1 Tax=Xylanimonas ulmi TaxID=228973 RepID=A0A4Q7LYC0_9MICO|nr:alpha/beta hydrolase-fold protein [Xylanibacterium ulmi]RZS60206.1 enterochelin esterase family protein [Xylanibacterium ulmi]
MPANPFTSPPSGARELSIPPHVARPDAPAHGTSPQVEALRTALAAGAGPEVVDAFWAHVVAHGTPLIEGRGPVREYTFAHRGTARQVAVVINKLVDDTTYPQALMTPIAGTDVWTLTLRLGAAWRGSYSLAVDDGRSRPASGLADLDQRRARSLAVTPPHRRRAVEAWYDLLSHARPDPHARECGPLGSVASGPTAPRGLPTRRADVSGAFVPVQTGARRARWHVPAGGPGSDPWDVLVLLDGEAWAANDGERLDAWAASGVLRPTATLLLDHGPMRERVADLTCNPRLVADVLTLIDTAPAALGAPVTRDPRRTTIAGQSLGGLSALYAQCLAPDRFGASVCQSGSLWWPNPAGGEPAEWLTRTILEADARLGRVSLEVGLNEWVLLEPTRRLRNALAGRCEALHYAEYDGGHDRACWEVSLPRALRRITAR